MDLALRVCVWRVRVVCKALCARGVCVCVCAPRPISSSHLRAAPGCVPVCQANSDLTWRDVQHIVVETSRKFNDDGSWHTNAAGHTHSHRYGFGSMDAGALVTAAKAWTPVQPWLTYTSPLKAPNQGFGTATVTSTIDVGAGSGIASLEWVQVYVWLTCARRGWVTIDIICPSGTYASCAVQFHSYPDGVQFDLARSSARTMHPHGAYV